MERYIHGTTSSGPYGRIGVTDGMSTFLDEIGAVNYGAVLDAVRAVTKSIRHVDDIERLCQELKTDPSFRMLLDEGPDEALDIITIATGLDMRALKQEKEKDMEKVVSKIEQHFFNKCIALNKDEWLEKGRVEGIAEGRLEGREEGIAEGIAEGEIKAVLKFIRWQRNRHIPESQILEALLSGFELDEATARQYMDVK